MKALALWATLVLTVASLAADRTELAFKPAAGGGFEFDTGILRGRLRAGGKSLGLTAVTHVPTGARLDGSNGLLSHYRVFTLGRRYGGGAWDWPSTAQLEPDGAVRVAWPRAEDRPFALEAVYRWRDPVTVDLETMVKADADLRAFEVFLASYFQEAFTNALVYVAPHGNQPTAGFVAAERAAGDWQAFPRDEAAAGLVRDGRWKLEPNPVDWQIRPRFAQPLVLRKAPALNLAAAVMAPTSDCFTLAMPHQTEGHYSAYLSLFGKDLKAGDTVRARARLVVVVGQPEAVLPKLHETYRREIGMP